jgi:ribonuclease-3
MELDRHHKLKRLAERIGHDFQDLGLLDQALSHSSYVHEHPDHYTYSNERLEFLGDAVLELVITQHLYESFPRASEGQLSRARSAVVNEARLAAQARRLELGGHLMLGRGEENQGGREKPSILADALEAVAAAVFLDGGLEAARAWLLGQLAAEAERSLGRPRRQDYKTRLQERVQEELKVTPRYELLEALGPDHDKTFRAALLVGEARAAQGEGKSKKEAEQEAARLGLELLERGALPGQG